MPPKNTKKPAAAAKTSAATSAVTETKGQNTKRRNANTPGSVNKKQKATNAGEAETDFEEGEADAGGEELIGDDGNDQSDAKEGKNNDDDDGKCLVRPDKAWNLVEQSHIEKQPAASYKEFLRTNASVSQLEKDEIDKIIPPKILPESSFPPNWTQEDEQDLQRAWEEVPKPAKVFLRLFRKSPAEVISAKYALRYNLCEQPARISNDDKDDKVFENPPLWSESFMENLTYLAYHPLWQGKVECLIIAIQYAVIVRTNDCRTWKLLNPTGDEFFNTMIRFIEQHEGQGMEMPELHKIARDNMQERGIPCGWFSMFMEKLEQGCPKPPPKQTEGNGPYKFSLIDLKAILKALTDMDYQGMPLFRYTGEGYGMEAAKTPLQNDLPTRNMVKEYHEREKLAERRWVLLQKRLADQERPVEDSTGFTVSAEPTGSGPAQFEIDQLKEENRMLRDQLLEVSGSAQTEIDQLKEEIRVLKDQFLVVSTEYHELKIRNPMSSDPFGDPKDEQVQEDRGNDDRVPSLFGLTPS
ncbi:hypothetical protein K4K59_001126 [Colletotrichum sp. SAR11_240]|nr:hypothetical protein K4K59_001126 [Colletotrichum sp. SAR11_240]